MILHMSSTYSSPTNHPNNLQTNEPPKQFQASICKHNVLICHKLKGNAHAVDAPGPFRAKPSLKVTGALLNVPNT